MIGFNQEITYWAAGASDGHGGSSYGSPVKLKGRWEDVQEQYLDGADSIKLSNAVAYFPTDVAGSGVIDEGGFLCLGDQTGHSSPPAGSYEIRKFMKTPDLRSLRNLIKVML